MLKNKAVIGVLALVGFILVALIVFAGVLWNQHGEVVSMRNQIEAQYSANQSNYDKMWKSFTEMTQVTEIQAEQFKDVYTDLISGRYEDTKPLFSAIQESNPQLGTEVYTTLQRQIAADRATFDNNQKKLLDVIRQHNTFIEHDGILIATIFDYRTRDNDDYIVTSDRTKDTFENGSDDAIDLKN